MKYKERWRGRKILNRKKMKEMWKINLEEKRKTKKKNEFLPPRRNGHLCPSDKRERWTNNWISLVIHIFKIDDHIYAKFLNGAVLYRYGHLFIFSVVYSCSFKFVFVSWKDSMLSYFFSSPILILLVSTGTINVIIVNCLSENCLIFSSIIRAECANRCLVSFK